MWVYIPLLPMGGSPASLFCIEGLRGRAKGTSVLHRGNGRSSWKVWTE